MKHSATKAPASEKLEAKIISWTPVVSGNKHLVWFHACFAASLLLLKLLAFIFQAFGLVCLVRAEISKTNAHWQNSFQSILSKKYLRQHVLKSIPSHQHCEFSSRKSTPAALWLFAIFANLPCAAYKSVRFSSFIYFCEKILFGTALDGRKVVIKTLLFETP